MCTPISPPELICEDCRATYLRGHQPGDLTFEQVDACEDRATLLHWAGQCQPAEHFVPQLCPADAAGLKAWNLSHPIMEPPC